MTPCTVIDITLVRVESRRIRGTMAPYWDPDCNCRTRTVFEGELSGDSVSGNSARRESRSYCRVHRHLKVEPGFTPTRGETLRYTSHLGRRPRIGRT